MSFTNQKVVNICPVNITKIYSLCTKKSSKSCIKLCLKKKMLTKNLIYLSIPTYQILVENAIHMLLKFKLRTLKPMRNIWNKNWRLRWRNINSTFTIPQNYTESVKNNSKITVVTFNLIDITYFVIINKCLFLV